MFETGRRSAISTSELGLYSDRSDRHGRNQHSLLIRKIVIVVMVVTAVVLAGIFLYDFTSGTSIHSKANQETKHIYILQNALKKSNNASPKSVFSTPTPEGEVNRTEIILVQDRVDQDCQDVGNDGTDQSLTKSSTQNVAENNLKWKEKTSRAIDSHRRITTDHFDSEERTEDDNPEGKIFNNHAVVYRVKQRYKRPLPDDDITNSEESRPTPFHFQYKTPQPTSFKGPKYPQLSQYRYPHASRNIQDIIKYLTNEADAANRGIKFTGVYVNPKKYDPYPEMAESMTHDDVSEEEEDTPYPITINADPFYQYKPKHPSDVNLLATSNVRFSPAGIYRYNPSFDPYYQRPSSNMNKQHLMAAGSQYDNYPAESYAKRRKPKPFSIMLDIYPITDIDQTKKIGRPKQSASFDDYDSRRPPVMYNRGPKMYSSSSPIPVVAIPNQPMTDEEERQQMIFHLNLYPRKKNKLSRHDILERSEFVMSEDQEQLVKKILSPFNSITKQNADHLPTEETTFLEDESPNNAKTLLSRYEETPLKLSNESTEQNHEENSKFEGIHNEQDIEIPSNHKLGIGLEKEEITVCQNCKNVTSTEDKSAKNFTTPVQEIKNPAEVQEFPDGLLATD
ncbi:uncharacterized protein LOC105703818 [Orussus abietinus]|uniref:uncharacterized protein LOC105703818 n=1 Tax=Orussus abietinus TaxID=222816 RepID=UPI000626BD2A|nr:uncharacterized protein LOC105703818 [Orussus abietinus]